MNGERGEERRGEKAQPVNRGFFFFFFYSTSLLGCSVQRTANVYRVFEEENLRDDSLSRDYEKFSSRFLVLFLFCFFFFYACTGRF